MDATDLHQQRQHGRHWWFANNTDTRCIFIDYDTTRTPPVFFDEDNDDDTDTIFIHDDRDAIFICDTDALFIDDDTDSLVFVSLFFFFSFFSFFSSSAE
jgi:hypothetical protein